jgi:hypothetical protein
MPGSSTRCCGNCSGCATEHEDDQAHVVGGGPFSWPKVWDVIRFDHRDDGANTDGTTRRLLTSTDDHGHRPRTLFAWPAGPAVVRRGRGSAGCCRREAADVAPAIRRRPQGHPRILRIPRGEHGEGRSRCTAERTVGASARARLQPAGYRPAYRQGAAASRQDDRRRGAADKAGGGAVSGMARGKRRTIECGGIPSSRQAARHHARTRRGRAAEACEEWDVISALERVRRRGRELKVDLHRIQSAP